VQTLRSAIETLRELEELAREDGRIERATQLASLRKEYEAELNARFPEQGGPPLT
jgi:hypothetical protein